MKPRSSEQRAASRAGKDCLQFLLVLRFILQKQHEQNAQLLLGHTKTESTVRYLGIEVDDALAIAEQGDLYSTSGQSRDALPSSNFDMGASTSDVRYFRRYRRESGLYADIVQASKMTQLRHWLRPKAVLVSMPVSAPID